LEELAGHSDHTAAATTDALLQSVRAHAGDQPQSDDITLLTLKRKQ